MSDSELCLPVNDRNIFTSHEIAQLVPLINKDFMYERFLSENMWIRRFLPNALKKIEIRSSPRSLPGLRLLDSLFFGLQLLYMRKKITAEKISLTSAKFHPKDKTGFVKLLFDAKYKSYKKFLSDMKSPADRNFSLGSIDTPGY
jgi:hypothetical protein